MDPLPPADVSTFSELLRELLNRRGMSLRDVGRDRRHGYVSHTYVRQLLNGERRPTASVAWILDRVLDADGALSALATSRRSVSTVPVTADALVGGVELEPLADVITRAAAAGGDAADLFDVATADIVARYEHEGPARLVAETTALRRIASALPDGEGSRRAAAQTSALLSYMAVNLGRFGHADAYAVEAYALAVACGDDNLAAWVRATQSLAAYYRRRYCEALEYADAGLGHAARGPQALRLMVNCRGRALAQLGRVRDAEQAVADAYELGERLDLAGGINPCIAFGQWSQGRLTANAVTVYQILGQRDRALGLIGSLAGILGDSDSVWSRSLVGLDHAAVLLTGSRHDVEQAMAVAVDAVRASTATPITSVLQRGHELVAVDAPWARTPAAVEVRELLRTMSRQPRVP